MQTKLTEIADVEKASLKKIRNNIRFMCRRTSFKYGEKSLNLFPANFCLIITLHCIIMTFNKDLFQEENELNGSEASTKRHIAEEFIRAMRNL